MIGKHPRYSVSPVEPQFRALAALTGRVQIGGAKEITLATLIAARLASGALNPNRLPLKSREARAVSTRGWLLSLPLPRKITDAFVRLVEATGTDDLDYLSKSFAEVLDIADAHLDQPSRIELGRLVQRMSAETSSQNVG